MKFSPQIPLLASFMILHLVVFGQQANKDILEGIWKGTSLCQVKSSPCHDEDAVYHISKSGKANTYSLQMNKIVNGKEEEMGVSEGVYDQAGQTLSFITKDRQGRSGVWVFKIDGKQMHGTLTINDNVIYRVIEVKKT